MLPGQCPIINDYYFFACYLTIIVFICSVLTEILIVPLSLIQLGLQVVFSRLDLHTLPLFDMRACTSVFIFHTILLHVTSGERAGKRDHKRKVCRFFPFFLLLNCALFFSVCTPLNWCILTISTVSTLDYRGFVGNLVSSTTWVHLIYVFNYVKTSSQIIFARTLEDL